VRAPVSPSQTIQSHSSMTPARTLSHCGQCTVLLPKTMCSNCCRAYTTAYTFCSIVDYLPLANKQPWPRTTSGGRLIEALRDSRQVVNNPFHYIVNNNTTCTKLTKWALNLSIFWLTIHYKSGVLNNNAVA